MNDKLDLHLADDESAAASPSKEKRKKGEKDKDKEKKASRHHKSKASSKQQQQAEADREEAPATQNNAPSQLPTSAAATANLLISTDDDIVPPPAKPSEISQPLPAVELSSAVDEKEGGKKKKAKTAGLKIQNDIKVPYERKQISESPRCLRYITGFWFAS